MNTIVNATLYHIQMKLKSPFTASYGSVLDRDFILVELCDNSGLSGWGECSAFSFPWYTEETIKTAWHMLEDFLIPALFKHDIAHPDQLAALFRPIRGNNMAKAALEEAVWDLYAKNKNLPLATLFGGTRQQIEVGAAVGIQPSEKKLLEAIERYVSEGYKRIKVKIKPGMEDAILSIIRAHFPDLPLVADANSAYSLNDVDRLKSLDRYNLLMIEQPLAPDDIVDHAKLQKVLKTPICLDESITSFHDAKQALALQSCQIINIKISRVGGIAEAIRIHHLCKENDIPVWCGGMLESGIGRAHNIALSSLPNFVLPGDTSASSRYWETDIISPEVHIKDGLINVSDQAGIGYHIDRKQLEKYTLFKKTFLRKSGT
mgnify:FL=1